MCLRHTVFPTPLQLFGDACLKRPIVFLEIKIIYTLQFESDYQSETVLHRNLWFVYSGSVKNLTPICVYTFLSLCGNNTMVLHGSRILRILINLPNYKDINNFPLELLVWQSLLKLNTIQHHCKRKPGTNVHTSQVFINTVNMKTVLRN